MPFRGSPIESNLPAPERMQRCAGLQKQNLVQKIAALQSLSFSLNSCSGLSHPLAPRNPRTRSPGRETSVGALQTWENAFPALEQAFCGFAGESTHLRPPWNAAALERS